eukprot:gnl/TRDRNA2_/TRDRNA2_170376_c0_seq2.p1 gnl/TRDRNA2_/TRDRNA2_170376_c0~~gnl/TRDRNA2_/TRDRNA2_170376_c0_seq2.p1  ORF type:complete len:303 (-),score=72.71 gnl/TRDRNA2_/TRDRNA2_170376_c0_seq2:16-924(-)
MVEKEQESRPEMPTNGCDRAAELCRRTAELMEERECMRSVQQARAELSRANAVLEQKFQDALVSKQFLSDELLASKDECEQTEKAASDLHNRALRMLRVELEDARTACLEHSKAKDTALERVRSAEVECDVLQAKLSASKGDHVNKHAAQMKEMSEVHETLRATLSKEQDHRRALEQTNRELRDQLEQLALSRTTSAERSVDKSSGELRRVTFSDSHPDEQAKSQNKSAVRNDLRHKVLELQMEKYGAEEQSACEMAQQAVSGLKSLLSQEQEHRPYLVQKPPPPPTQWHRVVSSPTLYPPR